MTFNNKIFDEFIGKILNYEIFFRKLITFIYSKSSHRFSIKKFFNRFIDNIIYTKDLNFRNKKLNVIN